MAVDGDDGVEDEADEPVVVAVAAATVVEFVAAVVDAAVAYEFAAYGFALFGGDVVVAECDASGGAMAADAEWTHVNDQGACKVTEACGHHMTLMTVVRRRMTSFARLRHLDHSLAAQRQCGLLAQSLRRRDQLEFGW